MCVWPGGGGVVTRGKAGIHPSAKIVEEKVETASVHEKDGMINHLPLVTQLLMS